MGQQLPHRKRVRHYHEPGDFHGLTFSCYRRIKLLTSNTWREYLARGIEEAASNEAFQLAAFVFMPEHVHLLVYPGHTATDPGSISRFLSTAKRYCSTSVKADLVATGSRLIERLTIRERPGKESFRFWQEGLGYDRNLQHGNTVTAAIEYIHLNPVRQGLVKKATDWRWSSARWYYSECQETDPTLPRLSSPPAELFD